MKIPNIHICNSVSTALEKTPKGTVIVADFNFTHILKGEKSAGDERQHLPADSSPEEQSAALAKAEKEAAGEVGKYFDFKQSAFSHPRSGEYVDISPMEAYKLLITFVSELEGVIKPIHAKAISEAKDFIVSARIQENWPVVSAGGT